MIVKNGYPPPGTEKPEPPAAPPKGESIVKWQHKVAWFDAINEMVLKQYGDDGWELCSVIPNSFKFVAIFKRPVKEDGNHA